MTDLGGALTSIPDGGEDTLNLRFSYKTNALIAPRFEQT